MEIVISIAAKIGEYLVEPIGRQAGYLIYYNSNIRTLKTQVEKLRDIKSGVQLLVDAARRNGEVIGADVERWLTTVDGINEEVERFLEDEVKVNKGLRGWCPDLISRYSLSRKVKKKTQDVIRLHGEGSFQRVSYPAPLVGIEDTSTGGFADFESRKFIMEEIMAALKDDNISAIGICGLGGIGKTTTVKEVRKRAKAEKLFDDIAMAVVTQTPDLKNIQDEIADKLSLKFNEQSLSGRADRLRARLMDCKRVLVILDDVWKRFDLEAVGIPFGGDHKGCKVILTSRSQDVCNEMETCQNFPIGVLSKLEAWNLLKKMAGNSIDFPDLHPIAKQVVKECGGLPIAILTVGRALRNKSKHVWNDALQQLRMAYPENISGMHANVYRSLELSFNFLESEEAKSCLLLCCIFEEDANIPVEDLVRYGMGLGLFKGIDALAKARDRVHTLVDKLKSCYLLLDSDKEECVKMHDIVRDVIRSIATTKGTDKQYTSISVISNELIHELLDRLDCQKVELLLLEYSKRRFVEDMDDSVKAPDNLFEGMKELKVLQLRKLFIPSPLSSLSFLTKLQTLRLQYCKLENISEIGELETLIILSFHGSFIKELPREIGKLTHLQLLDLTECRSLKIISPGVISSLIRLEELYMRGSLVQWEVEEGKEKNNVNVAELQSLSHLIALETQLPGAKFPGSNFLFENLVRFKISISFDWGSEYRSLETQLWRWSLETQLWNELRLNVGARIPVESGINVLLKKTKALFLEVKGVKNVLNELIRESMLLKSLKLQNSDGQEYVIDTVDLVPHSIFPILESLTISHVRNLKMIWHGQLPAGSFGELRYVNLHNIPELMHLWKGPTQLASLGNLRRMTVWNCDRLENVFSHAIARGLVQLESLVIDDCKTIEEIVAAERGEDGKETTKIRFPKLSYLRLRGLPSIIGFCKKMDEIEFPQLSELSLKNLPKLMSFCPNSVDNSEGNNDTAAATQHLFNQKVSFPSLKELRLRDMNNLKDIWSSQLPTCSFCELKFVLVSNCNKLLCVTPFHMLKRLHSLEVVKAYDCDSLEEVFEFKGLSVEEGHAVMLPRLKQMTLESLPKLMQICKKDHKGTMGFQNLKSLTVVYCGSLRNLFYPSTARGLVHLEDLTITNCVMMEEIVAKGEEEEEERMDKIMIPQLKCLKLSRLPNLTSFCEGRYDFDLPSLDDVIVYDCPKMKTFSFGNIRTPKLEGVNKEDDKKFRFLKDDDYQGKLFWMRDLNKTIQWLFERKDEDEDEDEDEKDEDKDKDKDKDKDEDEDNLMRKMKRTMTI